MDLEKRNKLEELLRGNLSVSTAQDFLSQICEDDIAEAINDEKTSTLIGKYKLKNNYISDCPQGNPSPEKAALWNSIKKDIERPSTNFKIKLKALKREWFGRGYSPISFASLYRKELITAALLIVIICPFVWNTHFKTGHRDLGIKGGTHALPVIQYALIQSDGTLLRADRKLTEKDTIAFRISSETGGFFSVYIVYADKTDKIISNQKLSKGDQDLNNVYEFSGNRGKNTIVMLYSKCPVTMPEHEKQELIIGLTKNNVSTIVVDECTINIIYDKIRINKGF